VLLPCSKPADGPETANAAVFTSCGGSHTVRELDGDGRLDDRLAATLGGILCDSGMRRQMSAAMLTLAKPHAASQVAATVLDLVREASLVGVA
jgi:UDP-N-acetylglucosamine:LPS N-acetylglucosamine transferase